PELRQRFAGQAEHVVNFFRFIAQEVREWMARLGFRTVDEMIGRSDLLDLERAIGHYKAQGLDFSRIFHRPDMGPEVPVRRVTEQDHGIAAVLDQQLLADPQIRSLLDLPHQVRWCPAVHPTEGVQEVTSARDVPELPGVELDLPIRNVNRTTGAILGSEISRKFGPEGLPPDTVRLQFHGSAGQSFGAFAPRGVTLTLEGDAQDYCGKGLSGGRVAVFPPRSAPFVAEENIVIGNVALYGATAGRAFFRGRAGERFAVRNSGVQAVVEGTGDHCCEYMTGGIVVVLGRTGRNFAAGMSGGIAFVLDEANDFPVRLNREMVELEPFEDPEDQALVRELLQDHIRFTDSPVARRVLAEWDWVKAKFRKVMPTDYRRVLEEQKRRQMESETTGATGRAG
ncbi:MAG: glutamate synthase subunit alpha, partial [Armatimonadetes bacterium]|nr:glutamate synthase subunit alpha [Armatimonadota bacterium]